MCSRHRIAMSEEIAQDRIVGDVRALAYFRQNISVMGI